jgi:hypothetical protein
VILALKLKSNYAESLETSLETQICNQNTLNMSVCMDSISSYIDTNRDLVGTILGVSTRGDDWNSFLGP